MSMSTLSTSTFWENTTSVDDYLASQLVKGRLAVIIGAGASFGFGLPSWEALVTQLYLKKGQPLPSGTMIDVSALFQSTYFNGKSQNFAEYVRECLYPIDGVEENLLWKSELLRALAALLSNSVRGSATCVLSFNFDNLLENYLEILGILSESVDEMPTWNTKSDIKIFHPHGLLPSEKTKKVSSSGIVFTASDYESVIGDSSDAWNQKMLDIFTSHTCLFIGLSGNDDRLMNLLNKVRNIHPSITNQASLNWAIRATTVNESIVTSHKWEKNKVLNRAFNSHDEIPNWILSICRKAKHQI